MTLRLLRKKVHHGQILIGVLIAVAIFAILSHALFTLIAASFELVSYNRARITARHIAEEKIEIVRNLTYEDIGTQGGIPPGDIPQEENAVQNGLNFLIKTSVIYIDDPADGLAPDDSTSTDYKRVRIEVSWQGVAASRKAPVVVISDIAPPLNISTSGGTLTILVVDANGLPVPQAQVLIAAPTLDPPISLPQQTGDNGRVALPGTPACIACYQISVTKMDYSSERTYSVSEVANPLKPHTSVFDGQVTQISFSIDKLGTLNIASVDSRENNFVPLGNVSFRLRGDKIIGMDTMAQPVYKYDEILATDGSGILNLPEMEWDIYYVAMPETTSVNISGTTPLLPLNLMPDASLNFTFATSPFTTHSLLSVVKNSSQNLIESAYIKLYDDSGFEQTQTTGLSTSPDFGQTFFSSLEEKTYHLQATASGYLNLNTDVIVSGYTRDEVIMTPE